MSPTMWLCPECYSSVPQGAGCACAGSYSGVQHVMLGAPGESPVMIGHLRLLDSTPRLWRLLEGICDGPRRYPDHTEPEARSVCWRHKGRTVWAWQENAENLPQTGSRPEPGKPSSVSLLRAMAMTDLWLIEAPQPTPLFRAHYARNRERNAEPPEFAGIIDRLQWSFSLSTTRRKAIALLDPDNGAGDEDRVRLAGESATFKVFEKREEALQWLLEKALYVYQPPQPSLSRRDDGLEEEAETKADRSPSSRLSSVEDESENAEQQPAPDLVRVADVGGSAGRRLMARLHQETWVAMRDSANKKNASVALPGGSWFGHKFWAYPTEQGLSYGRVHQLRKGEPPPGSSVPPWEGRAKRWWWWTQEFAVRLEENPPAEDGGPLIIGVGPSRLFGERELADLLERMWSGKWFPAAIIRHEQANKDLLRWVRDEFPQTPEFPDSRTGAMRALESALRMARLRTFV